MLQSPSPLPLGPGSIHQPIGQTSSEMFRDARNFDITGCQFINVRGDMPLEVVEPSSNSPPRQMRVMARSEYETFFSALAIWKRGRPLLCPTPQTNLSREYQQRGICIGDVGSITPEGGFDFAFNVYLPASHPINDNLVPDGFCPLSPYHSVDVSQNDFPPGSHVTSAEVEAACIDLDSPEFPGGELHFACQGPDGALIALPYGSRLEKLVNLEALRQFAARNAESWYRYINQVRGRRLVNGGLYVVTGCERARSGGMATFRNVSPGRAFKILFTPRVSQGADGQSSYRFSRDNPAHTRTFESSASSENSKPNNTVFLRGFTISLRKGVRRMFSERLDNSQIDDDLDGSSDGTRGIDVPFGSRNSFLSLRFRSNKRSHGGKQASLNGSCELVDDPPSTTTRDPAQMINEVLLSKFPSATVAITHDDNWADALETWSLAQIEDGDLDHFLESTWFSNKAREEEGAVYLAHDADLEATIEPFSTHYHRNLSPPVEFNARYEQQGQDDERSLQVDDDTANLSSLDETDNNNNNDIQCDDDSILLLSHQRKFASSSNQSMERFDKLSGISSSLRKHGKRASSARITKLLGNSSNHNADPNSTEQREKIAVERNPRLLWVLATLLMTASGITADQPIHSELPTGQLCTPAGECAACPPDLRKEPFCQPFGTRRLMHCANGTAPVPISHSSSSNPFNFGHAPQLNDRAFWSSQTEQAPGHSHEGETLAWAPCGRSVAQERADFLEFVACNVIFAAVAVFGVVTRARRMQLMQARTLAARIGLGRS
ncbi:Pleiotropic drug resistance ABC transporter protein [Mycena indigotica]|uniref:Pleiotropic drug resistance ABC transporter protein n=1 Tax=Mycena indigotica TaxID=2126181 RepID=A0A8H6SWA3_9AGAR|nr:Pleiotropic drug resistance ABC transporter protein [Mycena indigotica]KAF7306458.1 Pleiotropic drug resistance ABC transporter protein [Mycena indigotica]